MNDSHAEEPYVFTKTCPDCGREFQTDYDHPDEVCAECFASFDGMTIEELIDE